MYRQTTRSIEVIVEPFYLAHESMPEDSHFLWAYQVKIVNHSGETVQLLKRHWRISDKTGASRSISGNGVVGENPVLNPGDIYEYSSFTQLNSESGIMAGFYEMTNAQGENFHIAIPAFSLDTPWTLPSYH